jgi:AraC family transcriptional regulator
VTDDRPESNPHRPVYVERVNAAVDFIERNLQDEMSLERIADVAHFSPFHFHRVFGLLVGETLSRFISRLRLEKAATLLIQQPARAITEVASSCGIHSPSSFARSFRDMFGMSASEWRERGYQSYENESAASVRDLLGNLSAGTEGFGILETNLTVRSGPSWKINCGDLGTSTVDVITVPDLEVAYVRHTGKYQGAAEVFADIFSRLMMWAGPRGFVNDESWVLAVYHDNPSITEDDKLRVSACLDVPEPTKAEGQIGRMRLEGGACAVARFELGDQDYAKAWFALVGGWLPDSGYEPDDRLPFERYPVGGSTSDAGVEVVEICLPVRPLRRSP